MLNFLHPVLKRYKLVSRKRNVRFRLPKSMELENDNNIPIPVRDRIFKKMQQQEIDIVFAMNLLKNSA